MSSTRRTFLQTSAAAAAATQLPAQLVNVPTCPGEEFQPTADLFKNGPWIERQIPLVPLSTGAPPAAWTDCPAGAGPGGIAKEFGPSGPMEITAKEFLDDDDPTSPKQNEFLSKLVTEFGGEGNNRTEYYEVVMGEGAHVAPAPLSAITGKNNPIPFLGYGEFKGDTGAPSWPGPMFQARVGVPMVIRFINRQEDFMSVHLHGGHGPAHSDGHPAFVVPKVGEKGANYGALPYGKNHRDYFYPHTVPAHGDGADRRPDNLDYSESPSTMWYHDHSMDITGPHVGLGMAGFFPAFDNIELKLLKDGVLPFWSAQTPTDLDDVFNKQKRNPLDVCIALQDRCISSADATPNHILYSVKGHNGHLGHHVMVNGQLYPKMRVFDRKYRIRLLNGSNARIYKLALYARRENIDGKPADGTDGALIPLRGKLPTSTPEWFRIGADTWLYPHPVRQHKILLAMAKRADTIIDFQTIQASAGSIFGQALRSGEKVAVYLCNLLDQQNGRGPNFKLDDANGQEIVAAAGGQLFGVPSLQAVNTDADGKAELDRPWPLLKFVIEPDIAAHSPNDPKSLFRGITAPPAQAAVTFGTALRHHVPIREDEIVRRREVIFERGNGIWQINGKVVDEFMSNFVPELNTAEEWILENGGGGWWHPIHIHLESHQQIEYLEELEVEEFKLVIGQIIATFDQAVQDELTLGNVAEANSLEIIVRTLKNTLSPVQANLNAAGTNLLDDNNDEPSLQKLAKKSVKLLDEFVTARDKTLQEPTQANLKLSWLRLKKTYGGMAELLLEFAPDIVFEDHRLWERISVQEWDRFKSDTTVLGPNTRVKIRMKFRTFDGPFVFHCHNLEHEDMRMMFTFDPRPTPEGIANAADSSLSVEAARQIRDDFHLREQPVLYRHPWRFLDTPDFDKIAHTDTMPPCVKTPPWNSLPTTGDLPRAHPIWGGWDQHL